METQSVCAITRSSQNILNIFRSKSSLFQTKFGINEMDIITCCNYTIPLAKCVCGGL
jgi:hypothetical protein